MVRQKGGAGSNLGRSQAAVQYRLDRPLDLLDVGHSVDPADEAAGVVIREDGRGLGAIFGEAGADRLLIVVGAALELVGAADVAKSVDLAAVCSDRDSLRRIWRRRSGR